jgi:GNAT superfamily N-acetyltransferase
VWYTRSVPEMGFYVQGRRFGFYQRQEDTSRVRATVRHLPADDVPRFLRDLREYSGEEEIRFYLDDRGLDERIGPVLLESGSTPEAAEVFLAHTGGMPLLAPEPVDLSVEAVNEGTIEEAMRTERMGFSGSEAEPDAGDFRQHLALRRAEMGGQGRFLLARVAGEPASALAFYEGEDRFVHHLATRVPFRRRGIASRLLSEVLAGAQERGCRSTIISAAENGRPADLYRSLGFTDEVYWRRDTSMSLARRVLLQPERFEPPAVAERVLHRDLRPSPPLCYDSPRGEVAEVIDDALRTRFWRNRSRIAAIGVFDSAETR